MTNAAEIIDHATSLQRQHGLCLTHGQAELLVEDLLEAEDMFEVDVEERDAYTTRIWATDGDEVVWDIIIHKSSVAAPGRCI